MIDAQTDGIPKDMTAHWIFLYGPFKDTQAFGMQTFLHAVSLSGAMLHVNVGADAAHADAQMTKYEKMWVRTKSTVAMIGGFIFIIYMGHVPLMFLIFAIQVGSSTLC